MDFSLSSSLVGSAVSNPDKLALDLQFAADKTLTARKGPTPAFTRGSGATFVDSDGLVKYGAENLALQSENFGTSWVNVTGNSLVLNDALSPTNTLTADRIDFPATAATGLNRTLQQNFGLAFNNTGPITASVWLKTVSGTSTVYLSLIDGSTTWVRIHTACNVTTEWTRFSVTLPNAVSALFFSIGPDTRTDRGTPAQPPVQAAASVHAWGAQLERSSTARTYIPTTTAAVYGPRFDHNPVTLACKGLLIEESRTNLLIQSEAFNDSASWSPSRLVSQPVANTHVSPDGTMSAEKLTPSLATGDHRIDRPSISALIAGNVYTISVFVKSNGYTGFGINLGASPTPYGATFDLATGTVASTQVGWTASIQAYPNGWYRCTATFTFLASTRLYFAVGSTGTTFSYIGDETSGILIWGAQVEAGLFPTSYIPTTTTGLTRSADVCSITASAFSGFYNPLEGTAVAVASANGFTTTNNSIYGIESGTTVVTRVFNRVAQGSRLSSQISATTLTPTVNYNSTNIVYKSALAADINGADYVIDGTQIPDSYAGSSLSADNLKFTGMSGSTSNTTISSFRYYKKRLPVAKLQTITV